MGGKNAGIIFGDADLSKVVPAVVNSCFLNQGEICLCTSRLFVHQSIYDTFVEQLVEAARQVVSMCFPISFSDCKLGITSRKVKVGPPTEDVFMGPLISQAHLDKVKSYVSVARQEGGNILCGESIENLDLPEAFRQVRCFIIHTFSGKLLACNYIPCPVCLQGYFFRPTVLTGLPDTSRCMKEEIFGPVVCVTPFDTEDEVIERANKVHLIH